MANLTSVGLTAGAATSGTGTVSTIDNIIGTAGTASAQVLSVQGIASGTALPVAIGTLDKTVGTGGSSTQRVSIDTAQLSTLQTSSQAMATGFQLVALPSDQVKIPVHGDTASGSSDANNPVKIGGLAKTANPTAVTDGQRVNGLFDKLGKQVVVHAIRDLVGDQNTTITASTSATTIVTAVASTFLDLVSLTLTNTSATGTEVQLFNDDGTTIRWVGYVPPTDMRGIVFDIPLTQTTVNNTWKLKTVTSITSLKVTAQFVKNT